MRTTAALFGLFGVFGFATGALAQHAALPEEVTLVTKAKAQVIALPSTLPSSDEVVLPELTPERVKQIMRASKASPYTLAGKRNDFGKGQAPAANDKIVGGTPVAVGAYPFQAAILKVQRGAGGAFNIKSQFCGGTLVASRWVLSAAHCFVEGQKGKVDGVVTFKDVAVHVGHPNILAGGDKILAKRIIPHPKYVPGTAVNDIALIELERAPLPAVDASAITLVTKEAEAEYLPTNTELTLAGWGKREDEKGTLDLQETRVNAVDRGQCNRVLTSSRMRDRDAARAMNDLAFEFNLSPITKKLLENHITSLGGTVTPQMFCAAAPVDGRDSCGGDSGGPIFKKGPDGKFVQVGIVSFGVGKCGQAAVPGVYTRLSLYSDWLKDTVAKSVDVVAAKKNQNLLPQEPKK